MSTTPQNPNTSRPNLNFLYMATSGGGKSQALLQNKAIPKSGARVLLWDIDNDHKAHHIDNMETYRRELKKAVLSGKGFRLAYNGNDTVSRFEEWCRMIWEILDGDLETYIIIEELADVSTSAGKATGWFGRVLRKGRKFGAQIHMTTQRSTEISKTAFSQCAYKVVGQQESDADSGRMSKLISVQPEKIRALQPLQYFMKPPGAEPAQFFTLKYQAKA